MNLKAAGLSHVGRQRQHNEDSFLVAEQAKLYLVADGMGGHAAGEIASRIAVDSISEFILHTKEDDGTWPHAYDDHYRRATNRLMAAVRLANTRVLEAMRKDARLRGMGTTVVACLGDDEFLAVAHVGDSRGYRIRDGKIEQLTEDHSLLNDYIKMKRLTPEEIANFPHKNVIVRALGMKDTVKVDTEGKYKEAADTYKRYVNSQTDALVAEAYARGISETVDGLLKRAEGAPPGHELNAVIAYYLSAAHRDDPAGGCGLPVQAAPARLSPVRRARVDGGLAGGERRPPAGPGRSRGLRARCGGAARRGATADGLSGRRSARASPQRKRWLPCGRLDRRVRVIQSCGSCSATPAFQRSRRISSRRPPVTVARSLLPRSA